METFAVAAFCLAFAAAAAGPAADLVFHREPAEGRIVGGADTNISEVPYQLALEWRGRQFCAAALVSAKYAVSAGHCLSQFEPKEVVIRTGSTKRESGGKTLKARKFHMNPMYKTTRIDYDVAVIEFESPVEFDSNTKPVALAKEEPRPGEKAVVSGWGSLREHGRAPLHLQSLQVAIINRTECRAAYKNVQEITDRMICAAVAGGDACKGDSGGPIVLGGSLVGVVSWGKGCARARYPGVYANIANGQVREFLRHVTGL